MGLYTCAENTSKRTSFYENMSSINECEEPPVSPLFSAQVLDPSLQPTIDITITEPENDMNDSYIVPDGMFDFTHEKPNLELSESNSIKSSPSIGQVDPKSVTNISRSSSPLSLNNSLTNLNNEEDGNGFRTPLSESPGASPVLPLPTTASIVRSRPVVKASLQLENNSDAEYFI